MTQNKTLIEKTYGDVLSGNLDLDEDLNDALATLSENELYNGRLRVVVEWLPPDDEV